MTADVLPLDLLRILSPPLSQAALKYRSAPSLWLFLEHAQAKHNFRFIFIFKIRHSAIHGHWLRRQIESSALLLWRSLRSVPEVSASFSALNVSAHIFVRQWEPRAQLWFPVSSSLRRTKFLDGGRVFSKSGETASGRLTQRGVTSQHHDEARSFDISKLFLTPRGISRRQF